MDRIKAGPPLNVLNVQVRSLKSDVKYIQNQNLVMC